MTEDMIAFAAERLMELEVGAETPLQPSPVPVDTPGDCQPRAPPSNRRFQSISDGSLSEHHLGLDHAADRQGKARLPVVGAGLQKLQAEADFSLAVMQSCVDFAGRPLCVRQPGDVLGEFINAPPIAWRALLDIGLHDDGPAQQ